MKLVKSSSSILRKFLLFNFFVFLFLGSLTFFYLSGIQPNLVKQRMEKHTIIINNTSNHLERLSIEFSKESLKVNSLDIINLANSEGLHSHANSVQIRFKD